MTRQWRLVADDPPTEDAEVFAWGPRQEGTCILEVWGFNRPEKRFLGFCHVGIVNGITHWMPIDYPEPPATTDSAAPTATTPTTRPPR